MRSEGEYTAQERLERLLGVPLRENETDLLREIEDLVTEDPPEDIAHVIVILLRWNEEG